MSIRRRRHLTVGLAALMVLTGCTAAPALPQDGDPVTLDPAGFTADVDNPWFPLPPGTRWTYREQDADLGELTVVVTATGTTTTVADGIEARVVRDTVSRGDEIIEDTFDWYAQDASGTVWYLGEDTAEFEHGEVVSREGSFEAGVDGAMAGIAMPADPAPGMTYRQEYYRGHAEDSGTVLSTDELVQTPYGAFSGAVLTRDTNGLEPDASELKFFVRGIGTVLTLDASGGSGREELLSKTTVPLDAGTQPLGTPE